MKKMEAILLLLVKAAGIAFCIVLIGTLIFFCPPVISKFYGSCILFPVPPGDEYKFDTVANIKREEVFFKTIDGSLLSGWFFQSDNKNAPVVLFSHGNAGNIGHRLLLAKCILEAGASVFLFDYREFGQSQGKRSLVGLVDDSKAAYTYLTTERHIPATKTVLYGESIGGGPTCTLSQQVPSGGIILDSTFTSLLNLAKQKCAPLKVYPNFLQPIPALNNNEVLRKEHAPLLIIHGQLDEIIPVSEAQENFKTAAEPKEILVLPGSSHNDKSPDWNLYTEGMHKFFEKIETTN